MDLNYVCVKSAGKLKLLFIESGGYNKTFNIDCH